MRATGRLALGGRRWGLIALLVGELLLLTVHFDTQTLDRDPNIWTAVVAASPQYLRLALAIVIATILLGGKALFAGGDDGAAPSPPPWLGAVAVHASALGSFFRVTSAILGPQPIALAHPALFTIAWFATGAVTLLAWCLAFSPARSWVQFVRRHTSSVVWGAVAGTGMWSASLLAENLWTPLSRATFVVVAWMLRTVYPAVVLDPSRLRLGTPAFTVIIAPECSGYEGIGLVLAFLSVYLWLMRNQFRFPRALVLLPIGAAVMWILNAVRIAVLVAIGTAGWPAVATGGFHSQAGWIIFNAVCLVFVAVTGRMRALSASDDRPAGVQTADDPTTAFLAPLVAMLAAAMLTGAMSAGIDWLYPVRVIAAGAVLWLCRRSYAQMRWSFSWRAILIGGATFLIWVALAPVDRGHASRFPSAITSASSMAASTWLLFRLIGYVVTVPLAEELAFRGYLTRRVMASHFDRLPIGVFSWWSFVISSVVFGAFHGSLWLPGTIAGMAFAAALYQRGALGDAVQAHATTNGLLAVYVLSTGRWAMWS